MHFIKNKSTLRILAKLTYFMNSPPQMTLNDLIQLLQQFSYWKNTAVLNNWFKMLTSDWSIGTVFPYQKYFWNQYARLRKEKLLERGRHISLRKFNFVTLPVSQSFSVINSLPEVKSFLELQFTVFSRRPSKVPRPRFKGPRGRRARYTSVFTFAPNYINR